MMLCADPVGTASAVLVPVQAGSASQLLPVSVPNQHPRDTTGAINTPNRGFFPQWEAWISRCERYLYFQRGSTPDLPPTAHPTAIINLCPSHLVPAQPAALSPARRCKVLVYRSENYRYLLKVGFLTVFYVLNIYTEGR